MSMLDIAGLQLTNLTAYNEYITDVVIAAIVYLSAFSLVIRMLLDGRKKRKASADVSTPGEDKKADDEPAEPEPEPPEPDDNEKGGEQA